MNFYTSASFRSISNIEDAGDDGDVNGQCPLLYVTSNTSMVKPFAIHPIESNQFYD